MKSSPLALRIALALSLAGCSGSVSGGAQPPPPPAPDAAVVGGSGGTPPKIDAASPTGGSGGNGPGAPDAGRADAPRADAAPVGGAGGAPPNPPGGNPPAGPAGPWARGVRVGLVEISQGVFIKVGDGDAVVGADMRNAPVVEGRPLFARVHVATDAGFMARQLRGVLSVQYPDNTKVELEHARMVTGASNVEQIDSTFNFLVPAASVKPGATMAVSIYESGAATGMDPATPPRFPRMGGADLAVKAGRMEMFVVAVPVDMLMDSPERRKKIEQDVYDLYPVQKVNLSFHAPVQLAGGFSRTSAFAALRDAREMDNAKPYEYYHLLVQTANAGFSGTSNRAGASVNDGARRVAITIVRGNAIDGNTNTVAHELGHNHGSAHAPGCGAAGPDNTYPYTMPAGDMGVNGYSITFNAFKSRMMWRELMSYCRPRWISDFMWKRFEERVRVVTGFVGNAAAMGQMMKARSLQGYAGPGERTNWGIVAGQLVDEPATAMLPDRYALLRLADGRQLRMPVSVNQMSDDDPTREFAINLTGADFSDGDVLEAEVVIDGQRSMVPVSGMYRAR